MSATRRTTLALTFAGAAAGLAFTTADASAQAEGGPPGACACEAPIAPVTPAVAAPARLPKWGIGLRATSMGLAPESDPEAQTQYGGGGLQIRYRIRPRWQLELAVEHFTEKLENGEDGTRHLDSVVLSASYHFRPYARWDWYVLAGLGGTSDGAPDISDEEREASRMGQVHVGAGVERRFRRFAIGAELRGVGMSPPDEAEAEADPAGAPTAPAMTLPGARLEELSGGQLTIAGTYYF